MPSLAESPSPPVVVVIGTGGTIAGAALRADDHVGYRSGAIAADALVAAVPALAAHAIEAETLARLDSCDVDPAIWLALRVRCSAALARPEVAGVVITHGTDTLEETAYFLHRTLAAPKPVVLTAAMRPATALSADGPQNLLDAVTLAEAAGVRGVLVAMGGQVYAGADLRKVHGWRVDAFSAGDAGVVGALADGKLRRYRSWPDAPLHPAAAVLPDAAAWPAVDIVTSHAGARAEVISALVQAGARGLVIAGTGNGTVHHTLLAAARKAQVAGVVVRRASRCQLGGVVGAPATALPSAGELTPPQARIELLLDLMAAEAAAAAR
ncbi:MAG: asparaginase [Rubrivivax sp.]|nr:asparaginase [Rubrivivax sp.]